MYRYGKSAQSAIAAMSLLAEVYDGGKTSLSSVEVARNRRLSKPLMAKLLSILSARGLAKGSPGPGGGYTLAKAPAQITLMDVVEIFERPEEPTMCPFGPGWCGTGAPCPLHDSLALMDAGATEFLQTTTLAVFQNPKKDRAIAATSRRGRRRRA